MTLTGWGMCAYTSWAAERGLDGKWEVTSSAAGAEPRPGTYPKKANCRIPHIPMAGPSPAPAALDTREQAQWGGHNVSSWQGL